MGGFFFPASRNIHTKKIWQCCLHWYFPFFGFRITIGSETGNTPGKEGNYMKAIRKIEALLSEYYETFKH